MHELTLQTKMLMVVVYVTCMNESCRLRKWDMSGTWMSHFSYMTGSCHSHEWVMSRIWMSHVTYMNKSCHTSTHITSRAEIYMSCHARTHVTNGHTDGSGACHLYEWVMSLTWMSHVIHELTSRTEMLMVVSHIWMSQFTYMNESCHLHEWVMSYTNSHHERRCWW